MSVCKTVCPNCNDILKHDVEVLPEHKVRCQSCRYIYEAEGTFLMSSQPKIPSIISLDSKKVSVKHDAGKPELSIIPWEVIEDFTGLQKGTDLHVIVKACHDIINSKKDDHLSTLKSIFAMAVNHFGLYDLATSMMFGADKYSRDNWKTGFGGDYRRILECVIRHGVAYANGNLYDHEAREGFPNGNIHTGAIVFNLMVALNEISIYLDGQPFFEVKK